MAAPLRVCGTFLRTKVFSMKARLYSSYKRTRSGVWTPSSFEHRTEGTFNAMKSRVLGKWEGLGQRSRVRIIKWIEKMSIISAGGGGTVFCMKVIHDHVKKLEDDHGEQKKETQGLGKLIKDESLKFRSYQEATDVKIQKLREDVATLKNARSSSNFATDSEVSGKDDVKAAAPKDEAKQD